MSELPKPYYEDDAVRIYHGDCREILSRLPRGVVVTDPPYNIGYHYAGYEDRMDEEGYWEMLGEMCRTPSVVLHYPEELFRLSWTLEEVPAEYVSWVYPANTPKQSRGIAWFGVTPDFSLAGQEYKNPDDRRVKRLIAEGKQARLYDWWEVPQVKNVSPEKTEHPCQVPLAVMLRMLAITPADIFIDPFMGSGTTLRAAKDSGRQAIGIELEERYCEVAANRLRQEVLFE